MAESHPPPQPFAAVCNRDLSINDHNAVYSKVKDLSARWNQFAQSLHLEQDKIDIIEKDHGKECESCMSEALKHWLKRDYNYERYGTPCWRLVCIAVKDGGANAALADEIACEHPLPAGVTRDIYIDTNERNFSLVNKIYELQEEFAEAIIETKKSFNTQPEILPNIIDYLITHNVALLSPNVNNRTLTREVRNEFQHIATFKELFDILKEKYLSWFNYELVIKLVNKFLEGECALQSTWSSYKQMLNDYFTNSGILLIDAELVQFGNFNHPPTPGTKILIAKVERKDYTLRDLFFFRRAIPKELNIPEYELYFCFVSTSSLYLEFWIPDFLYSALFPMSTKQQQKLANIGFTELKCDKYSYDLKKFIVSKHIQPSFNTGKAVSIMDEYEYRKLIKRKLSENYEDLKFQLDGLNNFTEKMISNQLIAPRFQKEGFDAIMREFLMKIDQSNITETIEIFEILIQIIWQLGKIKVAITLKINWSVSHTKRGYRTKPSQSTDSELQSDIIMAKDLTQPSSSADRSRHTSIWAAQRNTKIPMALQLVLKESSQLRQNQHKEKSETIPGDEIHPILHLNNGLQRVILLKMEPVIKKLQLSLDQMINIILNEVIPCNFFIITFFDLHSSRKSTLIRDYLEKVTYTIERSSTPKYICNEKGLSVYNATLLKQWPNNEYLWFAQTKALKEAVSCGSAILQKSFHYGYKLQLPSDDAPSYVFKNQILDSHLDFVRSNLKKIIQHSHELQQILSSAAIHINIIDNDTREGAREFLSLISHHLSNNLSITWLTMNDVKELDIPLIQRQKKQRQTNLVVEAKIRSIIYAAKETSEIPVTFIIMCSKDNTISERDKAKDTLLKAIKNEIKRLSLPLQEPTILVLDPSSSDDMKKLNRELDKNAQCLARRHIKLSWLFLRSAVSSLDNVVISYGKLKNIAEKIGIKDREYKEFLETFTKFMSILYLPTFKPLQNVVILRPVEFVNKLSILFEKSKGFNGIYNMEQIKEKFPNKELADAIVNALCSLGLALETTAEQVDKRTSALKDPSTPLVFIPLARGDTSHMHILGKSSIASLFILFNTESNLPIPDCQSSFASELLALRGSSLVTSEVYNPNIFKILLQITGHDYEIIFIFQGTYIEVIVENYVGRGDNVLGKIVQSCKDALVRMSSVLVKFSYKLALECLGPVQISTAGYIDLSKKKFEFLLNKRLCHDCEVSAILLRKKWRDVIQKMYENELRERDIIQVEKLLDLAYDLSHAIKSNQSLKSLAVQLGVIVEREFLIGLSQSCSPWQQVFIILSMWQKRGGATKEKLKSALKRLGLTTNILD